MRLRSIYEEAAVPGTPQAQQVRDEAEAVAGDSAEAATQLRKQLEAQQRVQQKDPKLQNQQRRQRKNVLAQLSNVQWDPKNTKFQKLVAQALGRPGP